MLYNFAHAGHDHEETATTDTETVSTSTSVASAHTEQIIPKADESSSMPVALAGTAVTLGGVLVLTAVFYGLRKKRHTKKK